MSQNSTQGLTAPLHSGFNALAVEGALQVYDLRAIAHQQLLNLAEGTSGESDPFASTLMGVVELAEGAARLTPVLADTMGGVTSESCYFRAWKAVVKPPRISINLQPSQKQGSKAPTSGGLSARAMSQLALPPEAERFRTALMAFLDRHVESAVHLARTAPMLDLRRLFIEVLSKGGSSAVTSSHVWPDIAAELVHDSKLVNELRQVYDYYLQPLEDSMPWGTRAGRIIEYIESKVRERVDVATSGRTAQRLCESTRKLLQQAYWKDLHKMAAGEQLEAASGQSGMEAQEQGKQEEAAQDQVQGGVSADVSCVPESAAGLMDESGLGKHEAANLSVQLLRRLAANPLEQIPHLDLVPGVRSKDAQQQLEEEDAKLTQQHLRQKRGLEDDHKNGDTPVKGTKRSRARHHTRSDDEHDMDDDDDASMSLADLAKQPSLSSAGGSDSAAKWEHGLSQTGQVLVKEELGPESTQDEQLTVLAASHALLLSALALRSGPPGCGLRKPPILRKKAIVQRKEPEPPVEEGHEAKEEGTTGSQPPSPKGDSDVRKKSSLAFTPKCGSCRTCRNPRLKKACITNRERVAQGMEPVFI